MQSGLRQLYRKVRYGESIIVVSGLPRSGTSMIMKMLEAGGMSILSDGVRTADDDNPKGYYEHEEVKDLAETTDKSWLRNARGKVIKIISYLLKELPRKNNYKVLFMHRNLHEILASQAKMLTRRGETSETSDEHLLELYEDHLWKANYLIEHANHIRAINLQHRDVLAEPVEQSRRICDFLGENIDVTEMAGVVDEQLYRNRAGD